MRLTKSLLRLTMLLVTLTGSIACSGSCGQIAQEQKPETEADLELAVRDAERAMNLFVNAKKCWFSQDGEAMSRYYNPFTHTKSDEKASVWMYTTAIEAANAILKSLIVLKDAGKPELYEQNHLRYETILSELVDNLDYYSGTYELTSYTQTKEWTVFGVNRASSKGCANVTGRENVYDDQQWLIRELIESYELTSDIRYLKKAEYLADYVIDGWDTTLDEDGNEHGGIVWGPGYYTKHSCSNGPFISPLVWLSKIYKGSDETIEYRYIGPDRKRLSKDMKKDEYYLMYAKKVYDFQKSHLFMKSKGVYWDMLGAKGANGDNIAYETIDGVRYRAHNEEENPTGDPYSYNCGTMLSGAADLYDVTRDVAYLDDMKALSTSSFLYFAKKSQDRPSLYEYSITGFDNWFNGVLLRGWIDVSPFYSNVKLNAGSFQNNLDYAYSNYLKDGILPPSLLYGWSSQERNNKMEGMFAFTFAAEYAVLAKYYTQLNFPNL